MSVTKKPQPDSVSWKVAYAAKPTVKVKDETFPGYREANIAAKAYIRETGLFAGAVRV